jgi:hypothetical protein
VFKFDYIFEIVAYFEGDRDLELRVSDSNLTIKTPFKVANNALNAIEIVAGPRRDGIMPVKNHKIRLIMLHAKDTHASVVSNRALR